MKDIFDVDFRDTIRKAVRYDLKERYGIKAVKGKTSKPRAGETFGKIFGNTLEAVPSRNIKEDQYFSVPMFLVEAFTFLYSHLKVEGLFRKSGSIGRQKTLREMLERDGTCCSCELAQAHDVAALVKSFFREMPDPLLTSRLSATFSKCASISNPDDSVSALLLCCLLLPDENLRVLKYFTHFITEVANHSFASKMTLTNLAIVFAPNLTAVSGKDRNSEKVMKEATHIVDMLFKNSHLIAMIPDALYNKALSLNSDAGFCSSSADELDEDTHASRGRSLSKSDKKRDRSRSIKGFIRRNFKPQPSELCSPKHVRSASQHSSASLQPKDMKKRNSAGDISAPSKEKSHAQLSCEGRPVKRRNHSKTNVSPVRKSPRLARKLPEIRPLTPFQQRHKHDGCPGLPNRFELRRANENVSSSRQVTPSHSTTQRQSKLTRSSQKTDVRVSRRAASLEKRRAKYARRHRQLPQTPQQVSSNESLDKLTGERGFVLSTTLMNLSDSNFFYEPSPTVASISNKTNKLTLATKSAKKENVRWSVTADKRSLRRSISAGNALPTTPVTSSRGRGRRPVVGIL